MNDHDVLIELSTDVKWIKKKMNTLCEINQTQTKRIERLENWQNKIMGGLGVLTFLLGILGAKIKGLI